jgi:hypothetical protein
MTATVAAFIVAYPEFSKAPTAMLTAQLAFAEATVSDTWVAAQRDFVVYLTLADTLACSPWGRDAQLIAADAKTSTYRLRLWGLMKGHACLNENRLGTLPADVPLVDDVDYY